MRPQCAVRPEQQLQGRVHTRLGAAPNHLLSGAEEQCAALGCQRILRELIQFGGRLLEEIHRICQPGVDLRLGQRLAKRGNHRRAELDVHFRPLGKLAISHFS